MFHKVTELLAKRLDPEGDLIPVRCIVDENHFRPLGLVQKKCHRRLWMRNRYYKTDYKLHDILLPGEHASQPDICDLDTYTIVDQVDGDLKGDVTAKADPVNLEIKGNTNISSERSVKVKKRQLSTQVLDSLNGDRKINLDHPLVKQSEMLQKDLYIISETIETVEETKFKDFRKTEGSSILDHLHFKMNIKGHRDSKKAVIVPKACTLAFRVKRLLIRNGFLGASIFPDDQRPTFSPCRSGYQADDVRIHDGMRRQMISEYIPVEDRNAHLQLMEIEKECEPFFSLSIDLCGKFFNGFLAIIRNNDLLEELEHQLEQALDEINPIQLKTSRPELQELVDNLQDSTGAICSDITEAVLYFLQALDELSESELLLLEESVERKIVPKQTALVQCILELESNKEGKLIIKTQKVSSFIEDELDITEAMIKLSGLTIQRCRPGLVVTGNPDAFLALSVQYVALYVLKILSECKDG